MSEKQDLQIREACLETILPVMKGEEFSHVLIKAVLDKNDDWEGSQKAFYKKLTMGVIERRIELDYCISGFCNHPINKLKPVIRTILEMGAYQVLFMDQVYDTKACNLSVELAKKKGFKNLAGFVNGVLRSLSREKEKIAYPDAAKEPEKYLSVRYSMPEPIVEKLLSQYDYATCERMFADALLENSLSIRTRGGEEDVIKRLKESGFEVTAHAFLPGAYTVAHTKGVETLPGFAEGEFTIQDAASQLVGYLAPVKAGDVVFDVCAAPGGKSIHLADRLRDAQTGANQPVDANQPVGANQPAGTNLPAGTVYAFDVSGKKADRIRENAARMKADNVIVRVQDATEENAEYFEKADLLIADLPCSGLGVIGRKPDLKYRLKEEDFTEIVKLQRAILANVVKYVKKGGYLLYSTCTVNRDENTDQVAWAVENLPLRQVAFDRLSKELSGNLVYTGGDKKDTDAAAIRILPGDFGCDGFFLALFKKV